MSGTPVLERMRTGIAGLDEALGGGLPRGRTTLVVGSTGACKTILAVQTLAQGVRLGEGGLHLGAVRTRLGAAVGDGRPGSAHRLAKGRDLFTCGLRTDGTLACWGDDSFGQSTAPGGTFTQVAAGGYHACALQTDGLLACWGRTRDPRTVAFTQVAVGAYHTCGLETDGTLACWDDNLYGQANPPPGTFSQAAGGGYHTCGLKTVGTIACWGQDDYGQSSPPAGTFTQLAAGGSHTCGLKTDGALVCWGDDTYGQVDLIFRHGFQ